MFHDNKKIKITTPLDPLRLFYEQFRVLIIESLDSNCITFKISVENKNKR